MSEAAFQKNDQLTQLVQEKLGNQRSIEIGEKLGVGLYSVSFAAKVDGEDKIVRLFKLLGPNDQLPRKKENITKETDVLEKLDDAGVTKRIFDATNVMLRDIEETGPKENDDLVFWNEAPIVHGDDTFVAYQINTPIPGAALADIHDERADTDFVQKVGERLGQVLAEFHFNARDVAMPHYVTDEALGRSDHAFRMVRSAESNSKQMAAKDGNFQPYHNLAAQIFDEVMPIFKPNARPVVNTHGDLGLGNIIALPGEKRITGIVDWDKARKGPAEYDFMGISAIPGMLDVAANAYEKRMKEFGGSTTIDKALALKLALAVRVVMATWPEDTIKQLSFNTNDSPAEIRARGIAAVGNVIEQLKVVAPSYAAHATALRPQVDAAKQQYKGIEYRVA